MTRPLPERTDADRARVVASRASQGLPRMVEDPAVYARLAQILREQRADTSLKEAS